MDIYIVKPGDNVDTIAAIFGISVTKLAADNQLTYPYPLAIGQALLILYNYEETGDYPLVANGYAYPFIDQIVLEETLSLLTEISVFLWCGILHRLPFADSFLPKHFRARLVACVRRPDISRYVVSSFHFVFIPCKGWLHCTAKAKICQPIF